MSHLHRRDPRGDWTLDVEYTDRWAGLNVSMYAMMPPRYHLSMAVTENEALQLMNQGSRGVVSFTPSYSFANGGDMLLYARGIEVTPQEVQLIAGGAHPRDVLFGAVWDCGYQLYVVPDALG
jgi:hypothetical protein